jgi:two-component system catabolic regulation response regulator CreB
MAQRVLIVEDEQHLAEVLRFNLEAEGFHADVVDNGDGALARLFDPDAHFDLVVLDVMMPGKDGFAVVSELRQQQNFVPVLMLTARGRPEDVLKGFAAGADDYLAKPFSPRELVARVRSVLRRSARAGTTAPAAGSASAAPGPIVVDEGRMQVRYYGRALELSRYEFGLLKALASRPGHVFTREALLDRVWGDDSDSMDRTVDAHVKTLRAKMKAIAPGLEPIRTLRGSGYALAEDLPPTVS